MMRIDRPLYWQSIPERGGPPMYAVKIGGSGQGLPGSILIVNLARPNAPLLILNPDEGDVDVLIEVLREAEKVWLNSRDREFCTCAGEAETKQSALPGCEALSFCWRADHGDTIR